MAFYSNPRSYPHISRYGKYRQIIENHVARTETFNQSFVDKSDNDKFHRLDIIANIYYNDASLWWVIALANELVDPMIIKPGSVLRIPSIISLYNLGGALRYE